jgi:hypothetical protein
MKAIDISINNMKAIATLSNSVDSLKNTVTEITNMNIGDDFEFLKYINGYSSKITGVVPSQKLNDTVPNQLINTITLNAPNSILPFNLYWPINTKRLYTLDIQAPSINSGQLTIYFLQDQFSLLSNSMLNNFFPIIDIDTNILYPAGNGISCTNEGAVWMLGTGQLVIKFDRVNQFFVGNRFYETLGFLSKLPKPLQ